MSVMCAVRGAYAGGGGRGGGRGRCALAGAAAVLVLACACAAAASAPERDSQLAPAPFILGSRFGRSPPRMLAPRNDKFFMSSRYGKRSEPAAPPTPPAPPAPALLCDYTGLGALYRCRIQRPPPYRDDRRPWAATSSGDE